jgi:TonB family protein
MAAIRTPLLAQSGRLSGVVSDPSGAVVASARIDLRSHPGSLAQGVTPVHEVVKSNASGEYSFENIPDGAYDITIVSPGFAKQEHQGVLFESAKAKPMNVMLAVGSIQEKMQVTAERTSMAAVVPDGRTNMGSVPAQSGPPQRIRVGGNVQAANLIHKVTPIYPPGAKFDGVEGTVIMKAVIGKDGSVLSLEQTNKLVDPRLSEVAIEAVKQWMYKPTLLNGEPIEVVTEIEVNFTLAR